MTAALEPGRFSGLSCFVTGTDTGVGKTLVTAALVRALAARGARTAGMKPVAAGAQWQDGAWRNEDVEALAAAGNTGAARDQLCPYLLPDAMAPHIAAERAGVHLDRAVILRAYARLRASADVVVVEGVGGFCVPLGADFDTADLARDLALPVVLVVGLRLGCLNHAALTVEAIATRGLHLAAWVANTVDPRMSEQDRNLRALERIIAAPCLGRIPWLDPVDARQAIAHLDLHLLAPDAQSRRNAGAAGQAGALHDTDISPMAPGDRDGR
jgi:dethiobiotin synthetase